METQRITKRGNETNLGHLPKICWCLSRKGATLVQYPVIFESIDRLISIPPDIGIRIARYNCLTICSSCNSWMDWLKRILYIVFIVQYDGDEDDDDEVVNIGYFIITNLRWKSPIFRFDINKNSKRLCRMDISHLITFLSLFHKISQSRNLAISISIAISRIRILSSVYQFIIFLYITSFFFCFNRKIDR